ncbi:cation transporter [Modestobacter caceresii]|uniref:Cation transporter n=1 Tax=Modestobacter caceresii TaxID=1522368 RepID=A0A098YBQ9_9ACTN|nr:SMR family transporter [Modestobacter caceresii]KGH48258.1 cation transporter [Modestobacter caceresii]
MTWLFLAAAIGCEVGATMSLRASDGLRDKRWVPLIAGGYLACFYLLTLALREGLAIGVAYGIWAAGGVALTAVIAHLAFRDPLTRTMGTGIALIAVGVLLVELGAH